MAAEAQPQWPPTCSVLARQVCLWRVDNDERKRLMLTNLRQEIVVPAPVARLSVRPVAVAPSRTTDWRQVLPVLSNGVLTLREAMFARLQNAEPALYAKHNSSSLTNMLVYEVQSGSQQLVNIALTIVRDSLTIVFLFASLLWRNWQLTLFILLLAPAVLTPVATTIGG